MIVQSAQANRTTRETKEGKLDPKLLALKL